jgi:hypothetical protein
VRTLRRDRGFAVIAVVILALGIGANIAVFSVVDMILLRPLPFRDPQRLVWVAPADANGLSASTYSVDAYDDLMVQNRSYEDVTAYFAFSTSDNFKLTGHGDPKPVTGIAVAGNFFPMLGVDPVLGRSFTKDESIKGGGDAVACFLGTTVWRGSGDCGQANCAGWPSGDGGWRAAGYVRFCAVFSPGTKVDIFVPQVMDDIRTYGNTLALIGRLKPGASLEQAQAEATGLFPKFFWSKKYPDSAGGYTARPIELKQYVSGKLRRSLIVLWSAVGLILLIVCVNLSNLVLARAAARSKEFALRQCFGGGAIPVGATAIDGEPGAVWDRCDVGAGTGVWDHVLSCAPRIFGAAAAEQREGG